MRALGADVVLREATAADIESLVSVIHAAFDEYRDRLEPPSGALGETAQTIRTRLLGANAVLAIVEGEPRGCAFYTSESDHLYLDRLAVLPGHRRLGIASALVAWVESRARGFGVAQVRVGVRIALTKNREYFASLGYREIGLDSHPGCTEPTSVKLAKALTDQT